MPGKLSEKALEHRKFLRRRKKAAGIGVLYPKTRTSKEILKDVAPPVSSGGATGYLGMGSRAKG